MFVPRLIPRLDIKGQNLIKSINLEGLRVIGDPNKFAINVPTIHKEPALNKPYNTEAIIDISKINL